MPAFTYHAFDASTMLPLDPLPYTGVAFSRRLMGQGGSWAANLPLADPHVSKFDWRTATTTGNKVCLVVDYFGTLVWGGLLTSRNWPSDADPKQLLAVGANELNEFFGRRAQADDYSNTFVAGADPLVIGARLLTDALAVDNPFGGIAVVKNPASSGVSITPTYGGGNIQTIISLIDSLAQMGYNQGFDYTIDAAWNGATPAFTFNLWFPRAGRTVAQSNLTVLRSQMFDFKYGEDGTQQARKVWATASGTAVLPISVDTLSGGILTERIFSRSVTSQAMLNAMATGDAGAYAYPVPTMQLQLPLPLDAAGAADPSLLSPGMILPGDDVRVLIDPVAQGMNASNRFPDGLDYEARVLNISYYPEGTGQSRRPQWWLDVTPPPIDTLPPPVPPR